MVCVLFLLIHLYYLTTAVGKSPRSFYQLQSFHHSRLLLCFVRRIYTILRIIATYIVIHSYPLLLVLLLFALSEDWNSKGNTGQMHLFHFVYYHSVSSCIIPKLICNFLGPRSLIVTHLVYPDKQVCKGLLVSLNFKLCCILLSLIMTTEVSSA